MIGYFGFRFTAVYN